MWAAVAAEVAEAGVEVAGVVVAAAEAEEVEVEVAVAAVAVAEVVAEAFP